MSNKEIDPSTFEIGDEIKASHNEIDGWREIVRLFSAYLIVNGEEDYIVMHDFITAHRKPKIKPEKVFAIKPDNDPVNSPSHYTNHPSGVQCIDITKHMGFCLGNAMKYIWRADLKEDAIEDLQKAVFYLNKEIETREAAELLEADI